MRGFIPFMIMVAIGALFSVAFSAVVGLPIGAVCAGFGLGAVTLILGSIEANTRNARTYGRRTYEDVYFREKSDMYWQEPVHAEGMRRDRVRRHPEAPATFPASDVA